MMMASMLQALRTLIDVMNEIGDVVVVAPDSPQSGMGHAITIDSTFMLNVLLLTMKNNLNIVVLEHLQIV